MAQPENVSEFDTVVRGHIDLDLIGGDYREGVTTVSSDTISSQSPLEQLVEALSSAQSAQDFFGIVEGCSREVVEDAITLQSDQPKRRQLTEWLEILASREVEPTPLKERLWQWSELPLVKSVLRWSARTEQVRLLAIDPDGFCQVQLLVTGLITNSRIDQLVPLSG